MRPFGRPGTLIRYHVGFPAFARPSRARAHTAAGSPRETASALRPGLPLASASQARRPDSMRSSRADDVDLRRLRRSRPGPGRSATAQAMRLRVGDGAASASVSIMSGISLEGNPESRGRGATAAAPRPSRSAPSPLARERREEDSDDAYPLGATHSWLPRATVIVTRPASSG